MRNLVVRLLVCLTALALFTFVAVSSGHAKEKTSSRLNASIKTSAAAKQPRLFDADGYRLVSHGKACK